MRSRYDPTAAGKTVFMYRPQGSAYMRRHRIHLSPQLVRYERHLLVYCRHIARKSHNVVSGSFNLQPWGYGGVIISDFSPPDAARTTGVLWSTRTDAVQRWTDIHQHAHDQKTVLLLIMRCSADSPPQI